MLKQMFFILVLCFNATASIKDNIDYLASEELGGRKPGTIGNILATDFLVKSLKEIGVAPLGRSYENKFTIFTQMLKEGENTLTSDKLERPFEPLSISANGKVINKKVVFAGFGISIPSSETRLVYDDYKGIDVKDKIVIVMTGDPAIGNQSSLFRDPDFVYYQSKNYKVNNAFQRGASGVLFIENPMSISGTESLEFVSSDGAGNLVRIMAGVTTNKFVNSILPKGMTTLSLQNQIAKMQKPNTFELNETASLEINLKKETGTVSNVVGFIEGHDPVLKKEIIVLGAHFDHLGLGGNSSLDDEYGKIHHGADDNASGTGMVLQLAQTLKKLQKNLRRSYIVIFFNAEEMGLLGSKHFVGAWPRYEPSYGKLVAMLNFDMIGRMQEKISVMGINSSLSWTESFNELSTNSRFHYKKETITTSDHASFLNEKIPSLFFTTGAHEDYHRSSDTADKINYVGIAHINTFAGQLFLKLDRLPAITFNPKFEVGESNRGRGYGAHLGCIPEFSHSDKDGIVCSGISENSPAEKAGLLKNDKVVKIGEVEIKNIYDLSFALKYYRPKDKVLVKWYREGELMSKELTLGQRKH